jgi:plastocyanin
MGGQAKAVVAVLVVVAILIPVLLGLVLVHGSLPLPTPSSPATSTGTSSSSSAVVIMPQGIGSDQNLNFQPATIHLTVGVNNTVTFKDEDTTAPHNVWFTAVPSGATNPNTAAGQNSFYQMNNGDSVSYTLTTPGTYSYECQFHSTWMHGTITVTS